VQKFGGTSVGKYPLDIANNIVKVYSKWHRVAVVCSARSTETKSEGTTTKLLDSAEKALSGQPFTDNIEDIRASHIEATKQIIKSPTLVEELVKKINEECDGVINIISAAKLIDKVSSRTFDSIISTGEKLACLFMTSILKDNGLPAVYLDLSHVLSNISKSYNNGLDQSFYEYLVQEIKAMLDAVDEESIPIITGFFGPVPGGLIENIGRGYTDLCAALVAAAVNAEELQVWKEVDGIFTADPRKVPTARVIPIITPEEAAELTYYGSEVIHPFTLEQIIKVRIPIKIKNVINPSGYGTVVFPSHPDNAPPTPRQTFPEFSNSYFEHINVGGPTAVTVKNDITIINIHSNRKKLSHEFLAHIFLSLHKWRLVVDLISTSEVHVSIALQQSIIENLDFGHALTELRKYGTADVVAKRLCIISLVGTQMKENIGTAGNMFQALANASINIEMISQGASEINISAVIAEQDGVKALNVLHHKLLSVPKISSVLNLTNLTISTQRQNI
jgi:aspartate kinase